MILQNVRLFTYYGKGLLLRLTSCFFNLFKNYYKSFKFQEFFRTSFPVCNFCPLRNYYFKIFVWSFNQGISTFFSTIYGTHVPWWSRHFWRFCEQLKDGDLLSLDRIEMFLKSPKMRETRKYRSALLICYFLIYFIVFCPDVTV